jgi:glycosyltransferase involved in cell wall biosynthesis
LLSGDASYRSAGISSYIANLLGHLPDVDAGMRYALLVGDGRIPEEAAALPTYRSRLATGNPAARILWEQAVLPWQLRRLGADVLHAPAFVGPLLAPCPQVITVHDLSFLRYPQFFRRGNRFYLSAMTGITCRRAAAIIAVSHFTAQETATLLRVPAERIHTIYHGVDPLFQPLPPEAVCRFRQAHGLPERFILHVGTLEPRKNLRRLIQAFAQLRDPDVHLLLVGGRGWLYEELFAEVTRLELKDRVHFPGYVAPEQLPFWYNAAAVFAYVSQYEGFGLPVLESLACGAPTLTANATALPEAAGEGALRVSPDDVGEIAEGLHRLLADDALRAQLRVCGLAHAAAFTWGKTARETAALYRDVLWQTGRLS